MLLLAVVWTAAIWVKIGRALGRPDPIYEFAMWDGGLLLRGRQLRRRGMLRFGVGTAVFMLGVVVAVSKPLFD